MRHDVCSPLEGAAVDGGSKRVVHNQGQTCLVGHAGKLLDVQHAAAGVGNRFAEEQLGVGADGGAQFFLRGFGIDKRAGDAQLAERHAEEVVRATVDFVGSDDVVAGLADVEDGIEVGGLSRRGEHGTHTAFEGGDAACHGIVGRVLETRVEVALLLQVEEQRHLVAVLIFEGGALNNGEFDGFAVFRLIARVDAERTRAKFLGHSGVYSFFD